METEIFINIAQILKIYLFPRGPQIFDRYLEYLGGSLFGGTGVFPGLSSPAKPKGAPKAKGQAKGPQGTTTAD